MAVATTTVVCPYGQWTALCQLNPQRQSLWVQLLGGIAIISNNTNAQMVSNTFGNMPTGFFHSCELGQGPNIFAVSRQIDGEAVEQEWFAWPVGSNAPASGTITLIEQGNTGTWAANPLATTGTTPSNADNLIMAVWTITTGAVAATVSDTAGVPFAPADTLVTPPVGGTKQFVNVYVWANPGVNDIITLTGPPDGIIGWCLCNLNGETFSDQNALNTGSGSPITCATAAPVRTNQEYVFAAICTTGFSWAGSAWTTGWMVLSTFTGVDLNSAEFSAQMAWSLVSLLGIFSFTVSPSPGVGSWAAGMYLAGYGDTLSTPILTVMETFDLAVDASSGGGGGSSQGSMMRTGLPKLSPGGVAALVDLQKRLGGQPEAQNAAADTTDDV